MIKHQVHALGHLVKQQAIFDDHLKRVADFTV